MGSNQEFVEYVVDQLHDDCGVTYKKMFGEYGLFSGGKMFGMVCDDQLFVKPTDAGRAFIGDALVEAPAYPGAKPSFLVQDRLEDPDWLSELVRITTRTMPAPKPKKRKKG